MLLPARPGQDPQSEWTKREQRSDEIERRIGPFHDPTPFSKCEVASPPAPLIMYRALGQDKRILFFAKKPTHANAEPTDGSPWEFCRSPRSAIRGMSMLI